ncbi:hypothetical protein [Neomegalonema sp.]|uniref:hypothetical protein n=1 Tax=Neomegalonema sp. TaxID=2039713 RepID=UPI0026387E6E|nr:hypothetical protein [Neomegalonema sp.]MDD2869902.1 hypothetical protein [Neomegalonema sp.]
MTVVGRGERDRRAVYEDAARLVRGWAPVACAIGLLTFAATSFVIFMFEGASPEARSLVSRGAVAVGALAQIFLVWGVLWPRSAELRRRVKLFSRSMASPQSRRVAGPAPGGVNPVREVIWAQLFSAGPLFVFVSALLLIFVAPEISGVRPDLAIPYMVAALIFLLITEIVFMIAIFVRMLALSNEINAEIAS